MSKRIILASASPRRRELLEQIGIKFEIKVSGKEEVYRSHTPEEIVKELASMKAENVACELEKESAGAESAETGKLADTVVLGADTVVVLDGEILGKPADREDAFLMLSRLQGRSHFVYTGIAVLDYDSKGNRETVSGAVKTEVFVNKMSDDEIHTYVNSGESEDKAGAYGIQGAFAAYIEKINGDYFNVVGLPVSYVYRILKEREAV